MISQLPTAPPTRGPAGALARSPIRVAWIVIWSSFFLSLALVGALVALGVHYLATAVQPQTALLTGANGTVLVQKPIWPRPGVVNANQELSSGDVVQTNAAPNSNAVIQFADGSSVLLGPGTELTLTQLRSNRYGLLSGPRRLIDLQLSAGKVEANVSKYGGDGSWFRITSLGTQVSIREGTTDVWLSKPRTAAPIPGGPTAAPFTNSCCATEVLTLNGVADVLAPGGQAALQGDERATVPMGGAPILAQRSSWDLLVNWTLAPGSTGLPNFWEPTFDVTDPNLTPQQQQQRHYAATAGATPAIELFSADSAGRHEGIYFRQEIDRDVRDFLNLDLDVAFKINSQSLPGGGYDGTEYPFRVAVDYFDASGAEQIWFQGYYVRPPTDNFIVRAAAAVPPGVWFPQQPGEGVLHLGELPDPPVYIKWVEFSASGWDFNTDVREVRLLAQ